ncbi:arsenic resistance protein [Pseudoclavibacter endophyticus]|nr:arsenic resistance protein [Pseudoclavibacter endophyticus]
MAWMERHQAGLYLAALAAGAGVGLTAPQVARPAEVAVTPVLGLLLYATFVGVPFARLGGALRDWRFLATTLLVNFVAAPVIVFALSRFVAHDRALLIGVLFVLLTPCIDYVIVFSGLAGGASDRLLAAAPVLLLGQMALLPLYLWMFAGADVVAGIDPAPFLEALVLLIVLPLAAAVATQLVAARSRPGALVRSGATAAMVPLMMLTLAVVVASQVRGVGERFGALLVVVPIFVAFAAIMVVIGAGASRLATLDTAGRRATVFSGATRNSLVILPLALALPHEYDLAPLVVVTQTLVELVIIVALVRLVPRVIR